MFDISFSELFVVTVVALLVIGPEKLPKVARTAGAFVGRFQRYTAQIKDEVNREMRFEELQNLQREMQSNAAELGSSIMSPIQEAASVVSDLQVIKATKVAISANNHITTEASFEPKSKSKSKPKTTNTKSQSSAISQADAVSARRKPRNKKL